MKDEQIEVALTMRAVTLRMQSDSQEAGFLSAYYRVPVVPAFIVIQYVPEILEHNSFLMVFGSNGQLLLDLRAPQTFHNFKAEVLKVMVNTSSLSDPSPRHTADQTADSSSIVNVAIPEDSSSRSAATDSNSTSSSLTPRSVSPAAGSSHAQAFPPSDQPSQAVQNLLADRRRRLEVDIIEKEAVAKAERKAKAEARAHTKSAAPDSAKGKQALYARQQRKRNEDVKLERDRILRQIEQDKAERKEKEKLRRAFANAEACGTTDSELLEEQLKVELNSPRSARPKECSIQVRMFDGSTIRSKFPSTYNLRENVRPWVDKQRLDGDFPYTFKQILAPLPNRTLSISDEEESLQSLGLTPSATIVMVPVQGYTTAYSGNQGIVSRGASAGYNVVTAGAGLVAGALGAFLGLGQASTQVIQTNSAETATPAGAKTDERGRGSSIKIRTLQDQQRREVTSGEDHQFYNGNQVRGLHLTPIFERY